MEELFVTCDGFDGVAESVSEIEDHTQAGFALVDADDFGFHRDRCCNDAIECSGVAGKDFFAIGFEEAEKVGIANNSGFDALEESGAEFTRRQSRENVSISEDSDGLMEAADEVFSGGEIDSGLSADSRVDLREERRGNLDVGDSPHVDCGEKASHIADYASAKGDEKRRAVCSSSGKLGGEAIEVCQTFLLLAGRMEEDCGSLMIGKARCELFAPQRPDCRRSQNEDSSGALAGGFAQTPANVRDEIGADVHGIGG